MQLDISVTYVTLLIACSTNHPQLKWHNYVCDMHVQKQKTRVALNHVCKINAPHIRTYPYKVSATKQSFLQPVVPYSVAPI